MLPKFGYNPKSVPSPILEQQIEPTATYFSELRFLFGFGQFVLLVCTDADLAVHDAGALKLAEQVLQLEKVLAVFCDDLRGHEHSRCHFTAARGPPASVRRNPDGATTSE